MVTLEGHVQRVLEDIDRSWESELEFLRRLVREKSVLGEEASVQRVVFDELREIGLEPKYAEIRAERLEGLPGYSLPDRPYEGRPNVLARLQAAGTGGESLILNGHIDVVPATPEHHWSYDPWGAEIVDGRMYGRGAADMKSGVAAMIFAVRAIVRAGIGLRADVHLQTVIEEERTGNGALAALESGQRADAAIIPEPFGQTALTAQVGVAWLRVTVRGKGAHVQSGDTATNAILEAYKLIEVIQRLEVEANEAPTLLDLARGY